MTDNNTKADRLVAPSPVEGFLTARNDDADRVALSLGGNEYTYDQLGREAGRIANAIDIASRQAGRAVSGRPELVAVYASRTLAAYAGTLGVFGSGRAFLALNPAHPARRSASILAQADASVIVADAQSLPLVAQIIESLGRPLKVIVPELTRSEAIGLAGTLRSEDIFAAEDLAELDDELKAPSIAEDDLAYLVFTSGSTGMPKGVAITHGNLATYMRNFRELAAPVRDDRVATTYELTFDIALHDMFNAWWSGASLHVVPARALMAPGRFIEKEQITYWFSVASCAMLMQRQGVLKPGAFPRLRISMLCGEALPKNSAKAWAEAAPNSVLFNVYGPTETTMELAFYRWNSETSPEECRRDVVPIGLPFDGHDHVILDENGNEVRGPGAGELYLRGPQVGPGYWNDPVRTNAAFVRLEGRTGTWYRTGDLIECDETGMLHFVGRIDQQIKLRGHRIELGEVEAALRVAAGTDLAAVIAFPIVDGAAQGLAGFVPIDAGRDAGEIRAELERRLPRAMVPGRIQAIEAFPLNGNRKIDRGALRKMLETAA